MSRRRAASGSAAGDETVSRILYVLLGVLIVHAFFVLYLSLWQSTLIGFEFRQTQTALSVYWMTQGSDWLFYETPIFGAPWKLPLEFPLYQWIVAVLHWVTGFDLNPLGRVVSFAFFLGTLWPIYVFCRYWSGRSEFFLMLASLFLTSPLMLFWGRTFLMETTALFFAALWLAYLTAYLSDRRLVHFVICVTGGVLAILVKATTLPAFILAGGVIVAVNLWQDPDVTALKRGLSWTPLIPIVRRYFPFVLAVLVPFLVYLPWAWSSDEIKAANMLTERFTSGNVQNWLFGPWALRFKEKFWLDAVLGRSIHHSIGFSFLVVLPVALFFAIRRQASVSWLVPAALFLVPMLVFANLHAVHSYYQVANAIFLITTVALILLKCFDRWHSKVFLGAFAISVGLSLFGFYTTYYTDVVRDAEKSEYWGRSLEVGQFLKENTDEGSGIFVVGYNYSSELPYYSQRRAVMVEFRLPLRKIGKLLDNPRAYFGDVPIGAFVICHPRNYGRWRPQHQIRIDQFVETLSQIYPSQDVNDCRVFLT